MLCLFHSFRRGVKAMNQNSVDKKTSNVLATKLSLPWIILSQHLRVLHLFITYTFSQPQLFLIHAMHREVMCTFTCIEHSNHYDSHADLTTSFSLHIPVLSTNYFCCCVRPTCFYKILISSIFRPRCFFLNFCSSYFLY